MDEDKIEISSNTTNLPETPIEQTNAEKPKDPKKEKSNETKKSSKPKKTKKFNIEKKIKELGFWKISSFVLAILLIGVLLNDTGTFDSFKETLRLASLSGGNGEAVKEYASLIDGDPAKGSTNAPIVVVEFSDFQCPFCARFYEQTLPQIQSEYIDKGLVYFVYRDFPLNSIHPQAQKAGEAAECVRAQTDDEGYFEYHDILFANQRAIGIDNLKEYARRIDGVDGDLFDTCLDSGEFADEVTQDTDAAVAAGGRGTPFFIINGQPVSGAQPFQSSNRYLISF